jgi:polyisoprenyl-phosphate glycosyltransferase
MLPKPLLSVVSPVFRAEGIVDELVHAIVKEVSALTPDFEIVLVDDGSADDSWAKIKSNAQRDSRVRGFKLSRNFGQHHAITAGLDQARGEWVIVMDCDLQDNPAEIIRLYRKAVDGQFDIVLAQRQQRQDSVLKRLGSALFYRFFSYLTGVKQDGSVANFGIYHSRVIEVLCTMREPMRAFPAMINWVGFRKAKLPVQHQARFEGKSTYNWHRLLNLAIDFTLAYSDKPLRLTIKTGLLISLGAGLFALYSLLAYLFGMITVTGYASLIISIWFLSGLIIFILGILGLYLGKIFETVKGRPIYIIEQTTT